ncbi:MAG: acetate--CoA ligase [Candidatus Methanolliviera sp. GoM_asphalt]|nr:MAG: acetate--CoA ligase [Candidatus Methanolliviera sp. GoM_asphalt]
MIDEKGGRTDELKMIKGAHLYYPDPEKASKSVAGSVENFSSMLEESWKNPSKFGLMWPASSIGSRDEIGLWKARPLTSNFS